MMKVSVTTEKSSDDGSHLPDEPKLGHLISDLRASIEEERFEIETPRVHAEQDHFDAITVSKTIGPKQPGQLVGQPGPPMLEIELDWTDETSDLFEDLDEHMGHEFAIALYGDMHVWNVERPIDGEIEATIDVYDGEARFLCDARLGWRDFTVAGWR